MSYNFLDKTGLTYFWQKIKAKIPTKTSQLTNDSGFLTTHQDITGKVDKKGVLNVLRCPTATGYLKFAECDLSYGGYGNKYIVLFVTTEYGTSTKVNNGLIFINIRGNGTSASTVSEFYWLMKNYQNNNDNSALCWAANDHKVEFYRKAYATSEYSQVSFKILHIGDFETASRWNFNLINVPFIAGTPLDTPIGNVTNITDNGYINRANVATSATKATGDKNGADITTTYYKASNPNGYTSNTGTITGITMNGASKGTSGVVNLGTVLTAHQDISGKQDKLTAGTNIQINNNTISATDTKYTAGTGITIDANNVISASGGGGGVDLNTVYPVGSIYMSVNNTNPATLFGIGTWEQLKDRFLLGAGDTYTAGATGGEATHQLTKAELPAYDLYNASHSHSITSTAGYNGKQGNNPSLNGGNNQGSGSISVSATIKVSSGGSNQAHNNMPPYLVVYMWKRTA